MSEDLITALSIARQFVPNGTEAAERVDTAMRTALEAQIATVAPAVDAQPVAWTKDLSKWLRGEAGRHMASIAPKGATITSHALQLKLWADQIDGYASAQSEGLRKDAGWRHALEEAAKACHVKSDEYYAAYKRSPVDDPRRGNAYVEGMSDGCSNCADAIRALSQKDPQ